MINVVILGAGNVGQHLTDALLQANGVEVVQVYNRTLERIKSLSKHTQITDDINALHKADIYIIALPDSVIQKVSKAMPKVEGLVVHTSGTTPMSRVSNHHRHGILYPLQTFSKDIKPDFFTIPFLLESALEADMSLLKKLAQILSPSIYEIDTKQRQQIHLSAVMVNNFVNHINYLADKQLEINNIPTEILEPLRRETIRKLQFMSPYQAQTGPARRGDISTIKRHLELIEEQQTKAIYKSITQSIIDHYGKKL